ncbi:MAG: hypothetical protein KatS3mg115_2310 [Candidatus Poribacteria bacterium]|nr:MAG: hypothetical protein KatS3mg115_2310 [Candidatus Poribacteria bacterium]
MLTAVQAVQQEAVPIAEWGGKGTEPGALSPQTSFAVDRFGNLYVADAVLRRVQKLDPAGRVVWQIENQGERLIKPLGVAVDAQGGVYVLDLGFFPIGNASGWRAYYYAHCVRVFDPNGIYRETWSYLPLEASRPWPQAGRKALDAEGNPTILVPYGDLERPVSIAASPEGTVYILDEGLLFRIEPDGTVSGPLVGYGGGKAAGLDRPASLAVSDSGELYVADTGNHRIVVLSPEGELLRSFGTQGSRDGELLRPDLVQIALDGTVWVADEATYTRVFETPLPKRRDDPSPRPPESVLPLRYRLSESRLVTILMRRVQRFSPEGEWLGKVLVRFPVESSEDWRYQLRAIAPDGRLFYQHQPSLRLRVYRPASGPRWSSVVKTLHLRADISTLDQQIDNPDLDAALGIEADYRSRGVLFRDKQLSFLVPRGTVGASGYGLLRLAYDWNERERLILRSGLYALESHSEQLYSVEAGLDPERSFPQDDQSLLSYNSAELHLEWERTLNQDPYRYRTFTAFAGLSLGKIRSLEEALAASNFRTFRVEQTFLDWEVGFEYDLSPRLYATISILRGPARGGFDGWWTYVDETGALFARGFNTGRETRVLWLLEGYL